jgi:hypothetical protein
VPNGAKIGQKAALTLGIRRLTPFTDPLHDVKGVIGEYLRSLCGDTAPASLPVLRDSPKSPHNIARVTQSGAAPDT